MNWLKKSWMWIVAAIGVVIGLVISIISLGRRQPKPVVPKRPELDDVDIPEAPTVDATPADAYAEEKDEPTEPDQLVDDINNRYE